MTDEKRSRARPMNAMDRAEALFKPAPPKIGQTPKGPAPIPGARELVSIRLDQDVLARFQEDGPGWQDRINAALRKATGL